MSNVWLELDGYAMLGAAVLSSTFRPPDPTIPSSMLTANQQYIEIAIQQSRNRHLAFPPGWNLCFRKRSTLASWAKRSDPKQEFSV